MADVRQILARQAEWQKARRLLSWAEKLRQVEEMPETLLGFEALRAREGARRNASDSASGTPGNLAHKAGTPVQISAGEGGGKDEP